MRLSVKVFLSPGALLVVGAFRVAEAGELTSFVVVVSVVLKEGVVDGPRSKSSS